MSLDNFNNVCDRLASELDPRGYEDRRWAKDEGAKLDNVVKFVEQVFEGRDDFQIKPAESQPTRTGRLFIVTLGEDPVVQLTVRLDGKGFVFWAVQASNGIANVPHNNVPASITLDQITLDSVANSIADVLRRVTA